MNKKELRISYKRLGFLRELWVISRKDSIELANKQQVYYYNIEDELLVKVEDPSELNSVYGDDVLFFIKLSDEVRKEIYRILDLSSLKTMASVLLMIVSFSLGFSVYLGYDEIVELQGLLFTNSLLSVCGVLSYLGLYFLMNSGTFGTSTKKVDEIVKAYLTELKEKE